MHAVRYTPMRYMPMRCTPVRYTHMRCAPMKRTPVRYTPVRQWSALVGKPGPNPKACPGPPIGPELEAH
jgi:hypothetical protein